MTLLNENAGAGVAAPNAGNDNTPSSMKEHVMNHSTDASTPTGRQVLATITGLIVAIAGTTAGAVTIATLWILGGTR